MGNEDVLFMSSDVKWKYFKEKYEEQKARADAEYNAGYIAGARWLNYLIEQEGDKKKALDRFNEEEGERFPCYDCEKEKKRADELLNLLEIEQDANNKLSEQCTKLEQKLEKVRKEFWQVDKWLNAQGDDGDV